MSSFRKEQALHPSEGARFLFERTSPAAETERATYRASIFTPAERFDHVAVMTLGGTAAITAEGSPAGDELEAKLATMARLIARSAQKRLDDQLEPWPHRVLRWRGPGR